MKSTLLTHSDVYRDVARAAWSYRWPHFAGKFNRRAHFHEALVCEKDSTARPRSILKASGLCPVPTSNSCARLYSDSRRAGPQPERHFAFYSPQPADGDYRRFGIGKIVAGLRHHLCGGAAALRGVAFGLCPAVPGAHGKAGGGRDRWHRAGRRHPAEEYQPQPALDRGHLHRMLRFSAPAFCARRPDLLPEMRHAGPQGHGGRSGRAPAGAPAGSRWYALFPCGPSTAHGRSARSPVRIAQERLQPAVPGRQAVRVLHAGIAARYRFLASPCSSWWTASPSAPTCTSGWSIPSRSATARPAR